MKTLVVVGNGMVGQALLVELVRRGVADDWQVLVFGEEPRPAYDRVHLSAYFDGVGEEELSLADAGVTAHPNITLFVGERVDRIDRSAKTVLSDTGRAVVYDEVVLATGSYPFVPPIEGRDAAGCFVYRTLDDLDAIRAHAHDAERGVVIGGGLLGLEAANALQNLGLEVEVVEFAPRLMPVQVDERGSAVLRARIEELGITVRTSHATTLIQQEGGRVTGLAFADDTSVATDLVVFSAGIRPRDDLARTSGLDVGERGGIVIDEACRTSDPGISAIGECALYEGRIYGLVAPGYAMARVVADRLAGGDGTFTGADMSTKLKLLGVDVASFGDAHAATEGAHEVVLDDPIDQTYKKLVVSADGTLLLGGVLVGDASSYQLLHQLHLGGIPLPVPAIQLLAPTGSAPAVGVGSIGNDATICSCNNVTKHEICTAIREDELRTVGDVTMRTKAGSTCGSCTSLCKAILDHELEQAGIEVDRSLCEHFAHTRQELMEVVRVAGVRTFRELVDGWGTGDGCEICKPAVGSILASQWNEYILTNEHAPLQDTNDRFLANMQKDGTYSVVPRVPGGEITPEKLIVLGEVSRDFDLYTKITGGQRVDLFGATLEQLPVIWRRLVDAGFESGHAYGKALRTVKSCVGEAWCRYGVQDSTTLAINLEERYRGLRSPHKLKSAVSGCARECAEARSKDFGIIATEQGWNLYVCGNGGMRPKHAELFAEDLDTETLVRYIDRFLMFYVRTADRLQRTSVWLENLPGGLDHLREVVIEDSLGIADELEAQMARHVETYACEWKETLESPERLRMFLPVVNLPAADAAAPAATTPPDAPSPAWVDALAFADLVPGAGVCVRVGDEDVALFRLHDDRLYAIGNVDPFTHVSALSRGIVGDANGVPKVASPLHKQAFDLRTGQCLGDDTKSVPTYRVDVADGRVRIGLSAYAVS